MNKYALLERGRVIKYYVKIKPCTRKGCKNKLAEFIMYFKSETCNVMHCRYCGFYYPPKRDGQLKLM